MDGERKCQCKLVDCEHASGGACTKWQQCATPFCSTCQVKNGCGCPGIPDRLPCMTARQAKTALGRWSCTECSHTLGLLMRDKITKELADRGRAREVVRLFAHAYAPTDTDVAECGVSARFARFRPGRMCSEVDMAGKPDPVGNTKDWVVAVLESVRPRQPDVPSCARIHVEEEDGQVVNVHILEVKVAAEAGGGGGEGGQQGGEEDDDEEEEKEEKKKEEGGGGMGKKANEEEEEEEKKGAALAKTNNEEGGQGKKAAGAGGQEQPSQSSEHSEPSQQHSQHSHNSSEFESLQSIPASQETVACDGMIDENRLNEQVNQALAEEKKEEGNEGGEGEEGEEEEGEEGEETKE